MSHDGPPPELTAQQKKDIQDAIDRGELDKVLAQEQPADAKEAVKLPYQRLYDRIASILADMQAIQDKLPMLRTVAGEEARVEDYEKLIAGIIYLSSAMAATTEANGKLQIIAAAAIRFVHRPDTARLQQLTKATKRPEDLAEKLSPGKEDDMLALPTPPLEDEAQA